MEIPTTLPAMPHLRITGKTTRAILAGLSLWGGLMTGSVEAGVQYCYDPCDTKSDPSFEGDGSFAPIPMSSGPSYPVPRGEYISRWFDVGRPDTVVVSWNTPLNPALTIGSEPVIAGEPAGPNDDPISATLSETAITSDFLGAINLHVTGLQAGQSALLERFKTPTPVAPVNDPLTFPISSARMKDGFVSESGEVANFNVLNDVDEAPGNVTVQLNFLEPGLAQFPGNYLYRISSPFGAFDPVEVRFTVTEAPTLMKFTGQVTHQGNPVPYALVGALDPVGTSFDFSYNDLIAGATADANGYYELHVPYPSEFDVVAAFPGYAGKYGAGVSHVIASGETIAVDLELEIGTQTVSGTLAGNNGNPLPGVELVFVSLGADLVIDFESFALVSTDPGGAFSAQLPPGRWGVTVRVNTAADLGYMTPRDLLARFDLTDGPVEDIGLTLTRGDSLIWGSVLSVDETDGDGGPLPLEGIKMIAINKDGLSASWGVTDGDGDFRIAARPGTWLGRPFPNRFGNNITAERNSTPSTSPHHSHPWKTISSCGGARGICLVLSRGMMTARWAD